jgi:hypothetical protein
MTRYWTLTRQPPLDDTIPGLLVTDGAMQCFTLERMDVAIPEGAYPVTLTVSQRAIDGHLWAPGTENKLPLLTDVPGRVGIRMHAGNVANDSDGCILLGTLAREDQIIQSRPAVVRIVSLLKDAVAAGDTVVLTVKTDASSVPLWSKGR